MPTMDAITLLKSDHRNVKKLFRDFRATGERAHKSRKRIVASIITELSVHAGIEETVFYPQIRDAIPTTEDMVLESLEEHHVLKTTLKELEGMDPRNERFGAKVTVLIESVEHHIKEEESDLFPKVRQALSRNDLIRLGESLEAARSIVPRRPHPLAPDEPPGTGATSTVLAPIDVAVQGLRTAVRRGSRAVVGAFQD